MPKGADAATEIVASADLHAEAVAEDEWSGPVEDLFEALPEPTAEEREAIQRRVDEVEQYRKALSSRDRAELADLLREEDLPSWVRHSIADIIDPRRRWHPPWVLYDALSVAILAKNAKEARAAAKLDCPKKLKAAALAEARAVRFAYAYERKRTRDGLSHEEAIDYMCENLGRTDTDAVRRLVARGRKSRFFDGLLRQSNDAWPIEDLADWPSQ